MFMPERTDSCQPLNVCEIIERDCLSVLHKLHDQVNGFQLVQAVVQPLGRLFNPLSIAALVANANSETSQSQDSAVPTSNCPSPEIPSAIHIASTTSTTTGPTITTKATNTSKHQQLPKGNQKSTIDYETSDETSRSNFISGSRRQSLTSHQSIQATGLHSTQSNTYMMSPDTAQALIARLDTDQDVNWLMEIIGYGLSMPFSITGEQDSVKDCCTIYCEWLSAALLPYNESNHDPKYQQLSKLVPVPIRNDPNKYARKMLSHLYNVFVPRGLNNVPSKDNQNKDQSLESSTSRQVVLCHRVLRTLETITHNDNNLLSEETWHHILSLMLTINDKLLSGSTELDDLGSQLNDRILGALCELMLLASSKSLTTQILWKSFQTLSLNWRHKPAFVEHWHRITLALTEKIIYLPSRNDKKSLYESSSLLVDDSSSRSSIGQCNFVDSVVARMSNQTLVHTWQRFLELLGSFEDFLTTDNLQAGQAESVGIMCKVFSSINCVEEISLVYLARFYLCLQHCLNVCINQNDQSGQSKRHLLAKVIMDSNTLLRKDLDGINLLIPSFIKAMEYIFDCDDIPVQPPPRVNVKSTNIRQTPSTTHTSLLRRACISLLLNLLVYPRHFKNLTIRTNLDDPDAPTFASLKSKLLKILLIAMQTEKDATNMQMLFSGLSIAMHYINESGNETSNRNNTKETSHSSSSSTNQSFVKEEEAKRLSFVYDSNEGFIIKSIHLSCHLLINIWKHDTQVSLSALEFLVTVARVSARHDESRKNFSQSQSNNVDQKQQSDTNTTTTAATINNKSNIEMDDEYKQAIKWICDYICNQCSRPPPAHSRDMHSTIVAAYHCLSVWFYTHPNLLDDLNCIKTLLEVIELGISGQKSINSALSSQNQASNYVLKGDKRMMPSSTRVREAAECLLNLCMIESKNEQSNQSSILSCKFDTKIDEQIILEKFKNFSININEYEKSENFSQLQIQEFVHKDFKYFLDEDSILYAFVNLNHSNNNADKDSTICLIRTPFGKHCWQFKFKYYSENSKDKIIANKTMGLIKRPFSQSVTANQEKRFSFNLSNKQLLTSHYQPRFFSESVENVELDEIDKLCPSLDKYVAEYKSKTDLGKMLKHVSMQTMAEKKLNKESTSRMRALECEQAQSSNDLDARRLLMVHLNLQTPLAYSSSAQNFVKELSLIDSLSARMSDNVYVFYARKGKVNTEEIFESVKQRKNVSYNFFEFILKLGEPTLSANNNRSNNNNNNSNSNSTSSSSSSSNSKLTIAKTTATTVGCNSSNEDLIKTYLSLDHGGCVFDGTRMNICWSDMCQEITFTIPHQLIEKPIVSNDTAFMVIWLESLDDLSLIDCESLISISEFDQFKVAQNLTDVASINSASLKQRNVEIFKYFISPVKNGLYCINLLTKFSCQAKVALPIVDGITVSKDVLALLIRESIANVCRRRRLDSNSYQPPHVKRRLKIQEFGNRYKLNSKRLHVEPYDFYGNLFSTTNAIPVFQ